MTRWYEVTDEQWSQDRLLATFDGLQDQAVEWRPEDPPHIEEYETSDGWVVLEQRGSRWVKIASEARAPQAPDYSTVEEYFSALARAKHRTEAEQ